MVGLNNITKDGHKINGFGAVDKVSVWVRVGVSALLSQ